MVKNAAPIISVKEVNKIFYSLINPAPIKGEINDGKTITEIAGYLTLEQQVTTLVNAGIRLDNFRKGRYDVELKDSDFDDDDLPLDITRNPGFDHADAAIVMNQLESEFQSKRKQKKEEKKDNSQQDQNLPFKPPLEPTVPPEKGA